MQPGERKGQRTPRDEAIVAWLREVMRRTGLKPTPLAQAAKLAPSTLLRALDPDNPGSLEIRSIEKIVQKFGIPLPPSLMGEGRSAGFAEPDVVQLSEDAPEQGFGKLTPTQAVWEVRGRMLEIAGYLPGDRLLTDSSVAPRARDVVCAQKLDSQGGAETVLRVYDPPYLVTETADEKSRRKPLLVDNEHVSIWGTVVKTLRVRKD